MKKLKENKGMILIVFTVILAVLLVIAIVAVVYLLNNPKTEKVETQNPTNVATYNSSDTLKEDANNDVKKTEGQVNTQIYTCEDLKGKYEAEAEFYLFEDGTYNYEENGDAAYGYFGNYIINGNEIILNQLFTHGSDIGVFPEKKQIKGTINNDGSITLKLKEKVEFKKTTSSTSGNYDTLYEAVGSCISYLEKENEELRK